MRLIHLADLAEPLQAADADYNRVVDYELSHSRLLALGLDPAGPGEELCAAICIGIRAEIDRHVQRDGEASR